MKHITYWIIGIIVLLIIGLSFYAGRKSIKPQVIDLSHTDTTLVFVTDTVKQTITKFVKGRVDTVFADSSKQVQDITANELIDTVIIFQNDSLDFVADINFSTKSQEFRNFFDFNLRASERIKEIVKEVLVPMGPEIYQNEWVIALIAVASFLFGLAL